MTDRLMTRIEVQKRTGLSRTTVYRLMRAGTFPEPIKIGPRAVRWLESEIEAYLTSRPRASGDGIYRRGLGGAVA